VDDACEVAEFVEDCGEEVVAAVGGGAGGGAEEGVGLGEVEFGVFPGGFVDEPAEAVAIVVEGEGSATRKAVGAEVGEGGFGELAGGEICNL